MPDVVAAVRAQAARDDARIDRLFARHNCQYVYLDVGSNNGVQIRKLFEPHKYPKLRSPNEWAGAKYFGMASAVRKGRDELDQGML